MVGRKGGAEIEHPESVEDFVAGVRVHVGETGWAVGHWVAERPARRPVAYTIGLWERFNHPEVLMCGFEPLLMQRLLNDIGARVRAGERFEPGRSYGRVIRRYDVAFRGVHPDYAADHFAGALLYYEGAAFEGVQCFLPDASGLFPWDENCDRTYATLQPVLESPPEKARRAARAKRPPGRR